MSTRHFESWENTDTSTSAKYGQPVPILQHNADINMVNPISQIHGSHVIQCKMHSWNMKEMLLASLPSAVLSMVGVCRTDTGKGSSVQQVHFCCSMIKHTRSLTCGAKRCRVWVPVLCQIHLLVSLLDYTCWIFSPSLLLTFLFVLL